MIRSYTLQQHHFNALHNVIAAIEDNNKWKRYRRNNCKSFDLSGSKLERSSTTLLLLVQYGYLETTKTPGITRQAHHYWSVTQAGRSFARKHPYAYD